MSEFLVRISRDGSVKLALRLPAGALKGAGSVLAAAMSEEGRLVPPGAEESRPWNFETLVQDESGALLVGPSFDGGSLDEAKGLADGMPLLLLVARALRKLSDASLLPRALVSPGLLASASGEVLLLPPLATAKSLASSGAEARARAAARLSSSLSNGPEADASFTLAQAAYRLAIGSGAFEEMAAEPGTVAVPSHRAIAASLAAPSLDHGLAAAIDGALADPRRVSLGAWVAALEAAAGRGWEREISVEEAGELDRRRDLALAEDRSRRKRASFWRRRGGLVVAVAVAVVAIGLVAGDILRAQNDKPDYSWLTPRELVQRYYLSIDDLDSESLESCADKKSAKADSSYVSNITVLTKTRTAYEGKSPLLRAVDWVAAGKPAIKETDFLYGIAGLSISGPEPSAGAGDVVRYRAEYSFWFLDKPESAGSDSRNVPTEQRRTDLLTLERGEKGGWRIVGLERSMAKP
jgi:hypothetical protein